MTFETCFHASTVAQITIQTRSIVLGGDKHMLQQQFFPLAKLRVAGFSMLRMNSNPL